MNDNSEEKTLPATEKKLREARKKGQVARSQDLVAAVAVTASVLYVHVAAPRIESQISELIAVTTRVHGEPFAELLPHTLELAMRILVLTAIPLVAVVGAAVLIASLVAMRGGVFSLDPIKPNVDHINPAKGFQRVFSMKSTVEFGKAVVKVTALAAAIIIVLAIGLQTLVESPRCGFPCVLGVFQALLTPLAITALIAFVIVGIFDVGLQRWLFLREMRMTKTEFKREMKDVEGDPLIKRERQRRLRELAVKVGLRNASILLGRAGGAAVGLRFVRGETPVPIVVCKGGSDQARQLITEANVLGIPVVQERELAGRLHASCAIGDPVPDAVFQRIADILVAARVV